jgi:hypothetical protein
MIYLTKSSLIRNSHRFNRAAIVSPDARPSVVPRYRSECPRSSGLPEAPPNTPVLRAGRIKIAVGPHNIVIVGAAPKRQGGILVTACSPPYGAIRTAPPCTAVSQALGYPGNAGTLWRKANRRRKKCDFIGSGRLAWHRRH